MNRIFLPAALLLAGCGGPHQSVLDAAGRQSQKIAGLWWFLLWLLGAIFVIVIAIMLRALTRRHRGIEQEPLEQTHLPSEQTERKLTRVVTTATVVSVIILLGLIVVSIATGKSISNLGQAKNGIAIEPSEEFLSGLHQRLAGELGESSAPPEASGPHTRRRQVLIGGSIAAAAATVGGAVDHVLGHGEPATAAQDQQTLVPRNGAWRPVAAAADVPEGADVAFDAGTVTGFVHRRNGIPYALSGICTHQGCKLWLDGPADRLRCPCHSTSFGIDGDVRTHQLPIAPDRCPGWRPAKTTARSRFSFRLNRPEPGCNRGRYLQVTAFRDGADAHRRRCPQRCGVSSSHDGENG